MTQTLLHIDASARHHGSSTRRLTAAVVEKLGGTVIRRDLTEAIPQIDARWITANFTPAAQRSDAQTAALALSDALISEIKAADVLVIGVPLYNFGVPAALKARIDQIARAGLTFQYSEAGHRGLLEGKRAVVALATGGTVAGSDIDFASGYMRHILGFIGITDVKIIAADRVKVDADKAMAAAQAQIDRLAA